MNKNKYLFYLGKKTIKQAVKKESSIKKNKNSFCGKELPSYEETQKMIGDCILSGKPFSMIRPGMAEIKQAADWEEKQLFGKYIYPRKKAGFVDYYSGRFDEHQRMLREDFSSSDIISCFNNDALEEYLVSEYAKELFVVDSLNILPFRSQKPWTDALSGKRVLVISVFADYLMQQYYKREKLFGGEWCLPDMDLLPIKSVWFMNKTQDYWDYFSSLDYLYNKISAVEYDIALLSCGSLAVHLAPMIKKAGKQAIQVAGELQLLFGIKGYRWDHDPNISSYYNESWIRITKEDTGINEEKSSGLDGGKCYW